MINTSASTSRLGSGCRIIVAAIAISVAGCAGKETSSAVDVESQACEDLRSEIREVIDDPARAAEAIGLVNTMSDELIALRARDFRQRVRSGAWTGQTAGAVPGAQQANLAIVPESAAAAFSAFCAANPKPCPLLAQTRPGERAMPTLARDLDVARDAPAYRVFRHGERAERVESLDALWRDDFVAYALGCSFSFEAAMERAGIPVRHTRLGKNTSMYVTSIQTVPAPPFAGPTYSSVPPRSRLSQKIELAMVGLLFELSTPPPTDAAVFVLKVLLVMIGSLAFRLNIAPPLKLAVLPTKRPL